MSVGFQLGDRGPAVAEVRARLARLGLLPGSRYAQEHADEDPLRSGPKADPAEPADWETTALVSGEFDEQVQSAVREFQRQRGITVDGVVGPETFRRLEEARWRLGDRILSYAAAHHTIGEDVLELQQRLNAMGFECGKEDGHLGPTTDRGIRDFQRNTGIRPDGVCGPATFRALGQLRRTVGRQSSQTVREKYSLPELRTGVRGKVVVLDPVSPRSGPGVNVCRDLVARVEGRLTAIGTQVLVTQPLVRRPTMGPRTSHTRSSAMTSVRTWSSRWRSSTIRRRNGARLPTTTVRTAAPSRCRAILRRSCSSRA